VCGTFLAEAVIHPTVWVINWTTAFCSW
jgi:hypothetical protein